MIKYLLTLLSAFALTVSLQAGACCAPADEDKDEGESTSLVDFLNSSSVQAGCGGCGDKDDQEGSEA